MKRVQEVLTLSLGHEELWFGPCNESVFKGAAIGGSTGDRRGKNIIFSISAAGIQTIRCMALVCVRSHALDVSVWSIDDACDVFQY